MAGHLHDLAMASEFLATTQFFTSNYQPLFIGGHYYIMHYYIMSALLYCHRQHKSVLNNDHQCNFLICCFNMLPWATIFSTKELLTSNNRALLIFYFMMDSH